MSQHTPDVDERDVERVLVRDYAHADLDAIRKRIGEIEHREKWRVILACFKNGGGSVEKLAGELANAEGWYREIISEAEYPRATRSWSRIQELPEAEQQKIYDADWRQYEEWLKRE